ncbi:MAG: corrinoid protein [Oscillospiraceae bacterium]|nr:corrinoid protein [Oscillospiraceae bacterium]
MSEILSEINANMQAGKAKIVKTLVSDALSQGVAPTDILNKALLSGMTEIGEKFKNGDIFVPEVLVAARAMNAGIDLIRPYLVAEGVESKGTAVIGTIKGDLHDIGKNLVRMMMEGRGINVVDLGSDVEPQRFFDEAKAHNAQLVCCSALLTTTMNGMRDVVKLFEDAGMRDKVKIMVGGAPVNQAFCDSIKADCYTPDAASAADAALSYLAG